MDAKILRPTYPRKRWFRTVLPCNLALACFSLALCLHAGEASARGYNYEVGEGQGFANLQKVFGGGSFFNDGDTITLYNDDSSLVNGSMTINTAAGVLTIKSNDSTIRTIQQDSNRAAPEVGGLFQLKNTDTKPMNLVLKNLVLADSVAQGGETTPGSGWGGAIASDTVVWIGDSSKKVIFENNQAIGGNSSGIDTDDADVADSSYSGWGGAIYGNAVIMDTVSDITFQNNQAIGGNSSGGSDSSGSGWGGAIYSNLVSMNNVKNITFQNNQAIGGIITGIGDTSASGLGGAIAAGSVFITDSKSIVFEGNRAIGGYQTAGNEGGLYIYGHSGLGGAIFINEGDLILVNTSFQDNSATTRHSGDISSGRGGAIFVSARNASSETQNLSIAATDGQTVQIQGNTHNPGGSGTVANSIYFGNLYETDSGTIAATFHTDANSKILMYDPMASQVDGLHVDLDPNDEIENADRGNIALLEINKTGAGTWLLAGHNDMQSATTWTISEGTTHLGDGAGTIAHIDLSHEETADFTLKDGAILEIDPMGQSHRISANNITLEKDSVVSIDASGALYAPVLNVGTGHQELLHLEARESIDNQNELDDSKTSGSFYRNAYNYTYSNLEWNDDGTILSADFTSQLDTDRGAISATTAATAIAINQPFSRTLFNHMDRLFRNVPQYDPRTRRYVDSGSGMGDMNFVASRDGGSFMANFAPSAGANDRRHTVPNNFWVNPGYAYTNQSGHSNYDIKTPFIAGGYDRWVENSMFIGAALFYSQPDYDSSRADVEADSFSVALYGGGILTGGLELSTFVSYGINDMDQTRRVYHLPELRDLH